MWRVCSCMVEIGTIKSFAKSQSIEGCRGTWTLLLKHSFTHLFTYSQLHSNTVKSNNCQRPSGWAWRCAAHLASDSCLLINIPLEGKKSQWSCFLHRAKRRKKICFYYKWLTTRQVFMPKCQHALPWTSRLTCQGPQATLKWGKESNSAEDSIHWLKLNIFYRTSQRRLKPPSQKASSCLYKVCCKIIQFNSTHRTDVYIQNQKMFFSSKA